MIEDTHVPSHKLIMMLPNFYNVFVGAETGLVKGVHVEKNHWANLNSLETVNKQNEITTMCWGNSEQTEVCVGLRSQNVLVYDCASEQFQPVVECHGGTGSLRGLAKYDDVFVTCVESGLLKVWRSGDDTVELNVGDNVHRMCQDPCQPHQVTTGGKENDLKLWDLQNPAEPVWKAKNVRNDWLNLRVPVWVTDMAFIPQSQKIVTSTGHHQVRVYDPGCPQRRPVVDITWNEYPITSMSLHPNSHQVMVGNTHGDMALLDLRKTSKGGSLVQSYKGVAGAIRCLQCHPTLPLVASCGLDRFVRIHNIDTRELLVKFLNPCYAANWAQYVQYFMESFANPVVVGPGPATSGFARMTKKYWQQAHQFYMKSRLNCLLFAEQWTVGTNEEKVDEEVVVKEEEIEAKDDQGGSEDDELWSHLPRVKTKKLKRKPKHEHDEDQSDEEDIDSVAAPKKTRHKECSQPESRHKKSKKNKLKGKLRS